MLKLADVKPLAFEIQLPDGTLRTFEPLETGAKLQRAIAETDGMVDSFFDAVRVTLGFPTQKDVDAASTDAKPFTLTPAMCSAVNKALLKLVEEASDPKKA